MRKNSWICGGGRPLGAGGVGLAAEVLLLLLLPNVERTVSSTKVEGGRAKRGLLRLPSSLVSPPRRDPISLLLLLSPLLWVGLLLPLWPRERGRRADPAAAAAAAARADRTRQAIDTEGRDTQTEQQQLAREGKGYKGISKCVAKDIVTSSQEIVQFPRNDCNSSPFIPRNLNFFFVCLTLCC